MFRRAINVYQRQALRSFREDHRRRDRDQRDDAGMQTCLRHEAISEAQRNQQISLTQERNLPFENGGAMVNK